MQYHLFLKEAVDAIERIAPLYLAQREWDNVGLLIEPPFPSPSSQRDILLTNDLTRKVLNEALDIGSIGLIISYHPPIFKPLKRIIAADFTGYLVGTCLSKGIAVYSPHTALDNCRNGLNDWIAKGLGLTDITPIKPFNIPEIDQVLCAGSGTGRIGHYAEPVLLRDVVEKVKGLFGTQYLLCANPHSSLDVELMKVAICAGSGASVLSQVNADVYITGEMSHHSALSANKDNVIVIAATHSRSERGYLPVFKEKLLRIMSKRPDGMSKTKIFISSKDRDPFDFI